jgi:hypothetical protein
LEIAQFDHRRWHADAGAFIVCKLSGRLSYPNAQLCKRETSAIAVCCSQVRKWRCLSLESQAPKEKAEMMKHVDLYALTVVLTLAGYQPVAAFEDRTEKLMKLHVASYFVIAECGDQYSVNNGGFRLWADKSGYPLRLLVAPVHAALMIEEDGNYKKQDLIPEVTQMVREVEKPLQEELTHDRAAFCNKFGDVLVSEGILTRTTKAE